MRALTLSGWAQAHDALAPVAPDGAIHFDYGTLTSLEDCFGQLEALGEFDIVIGWSMGGQLAMRAIAAGQLKTKRLVLLGVPYQIAADAHYTKASPPEKLAATRAMFIAGADEMMQKFLPLMASGDAKEREIIRNLRKHIVDFSKEHYWLLWFDELVQFSCRELDFSHFPPTEILHGEKDLVVLAAQAVTLGEKIPGARVYLLPECSHVPHWHDATFIRHVITGS